MPSFDKHQTQYLHNKKLLNLDAFSETGDYKDWYITILFYSAVHLVDTEFSKTGYHPTTHEKRNKNIITLSQLKEISSAYVALYVQSRRSRYDCVKITKEDIEKAKEYFEKIETHLNKKTA